jgi:hypothetical protein
MPDVTIAERAAILLAKKRHGVVWQIVSGKTRKSGYRLF